MKNRVLRSTLAVILVIAMVLTMAACGGEEVTPTVAPTTTPTAAPATKAPVAPTAAPTVAPTTAPTVAPSVDDKDTVADDFGIKLEAVDGTYGTDLKKVDGNDYGYFKLTVDQAKTKGYTVSIKLDDEEIYASAPGTISTDDYYDGDAAANNFGYKKDKGEVYLAVSNAGLYEIELEVLVTDPATEFGAWKGEAAEYETALTAALTVAKKEVDVTFNPIVVPAADKVMKMDDSDNSKVKVGETTYDQGFAPSTALPAGYDLVYTLAYTEKATVGSYTVSVSVKKAGETVDLDEINEDVDNVVYNSIQDKATIYVISSYDWNELRDVVTSISDINATVLAYNGTVDANNDFTLSNAYYNPTAAINAVTATAPAKAVNEKMIIFEEKNWDDSDTTIDVDDLYEYLEGIWADDYHNAATVSSFTGGTYASYTANHVNQLTLAMARYNALSAEQQAWFKTGLVAEVGIAGDAVSTPVNASVAAGLISKDLSTAAQYYKFMTLTQDAVDEAAVIKGFVDVAKEAKITSYLDATDGYLITKSAAITAFNTVDDYFTAQSDDDQDTIEADNSAEYAAYAAAKAAFGSANIKGVVELTVGAYAAYLKALDNDVKVIYAFDDDAANVVIKEWAYINSAEVQALTAKAQAAYDELTDAQQDAFDDIGVIEQLKNGTAAADQEDAVIFDGGKAAPKTVLDQLGAMNKMVDVMLEIIEYVSLDDYAYTGAAVTTSIYDRLTSLIFGKNRAGDADAFIFSDDTADANTNNAMSDLMAPTTSERHYDAIIAEYQAWIDYIIYIDDMKTDLVAQFKTGAVAGVEEIAEDVDAANYTEATNMTANMAKKVTDAIIAEQTSASHAFEGTNRTISDVTAGTISIATILADCETFEEMYEALADFCEIDDVIDGYVEYVENNMAA